MFDRLLASLNRFAAPAPAGGSAASFAPPAPQRSVLLWAVVASLAIHAGMLAVRFKLVDPSLFANRSPALEVVLVNARTTTAPTNADVLAQANLDRGGNTDVERRARTPLPAPPRVTQHTDIAATTRKAQALERKAQDMITALKGLPAPTAEPAPAEGPARPDLPLAREVTRQTLEVMRLEAQISRDLELYQNQPKRKQVGVRATEYRFARYVEDWRQKVERWGNLNYPEAARQQHLYGSLVLTVAIRADGSVENIVVTRSSGHRLLDAAAVRIVEIAAPYAPLPPEIRKDTEVLEITRTWTFARGDELRSD